MQFTSTILMFTSAITSLSAAAAMPASNKQLRSTGEAPIELWGGEGCSGEMAGPISYPINQYMSLTEGGWSFNVNNWAYCINVGKGYYVEVYNNYESESSCSGYLGGYYGGKTYEISQPKEASCVYIRSCGDNCGTKA